VILACVLGSGMTAIDATVVGIALPAIGREFGVGLSSLQWVVTSYTLTLAALLLLGGTLGDRFGRRRVFSIGVAWFLLASAAAAAAPGIGALIATRALQGVGAALLTPGSLSILQASFSADDRNAAIGVWAGFGGVATAAGPLIGGWLISASSWRWIFIINVPIGAVVLRIANRRIPESRDPAASVGPHDLRGPALAVVWLAALSFGLIEGSALGWSTPVVVAALVVAVIAAAAFFLAEVRAQHPMLPLSIFRNRRFAGTNIVTFIVYGALGAALFLLPSVLQVVGGWSPLESGTALLPVTAIMLVLSARSARLAARIGPRLQMSVGPLLVGAGLALLGRATGGDYVTDVLPAAVVFGLGLAVTVAPLTATAMSSAPAQRAGLASAVNNDVARFAGLLAVAVLPGLAGIGGTGYLDPQVLAEGFRTAVRISAGLCVVAGLVAALTIGGEPASGPGRTRRARRAPTGADLHCALDGPPLDDWRLGAEPAPGTAADGDRSP
jgi:EmrB/QacA subfamily drug resistance transporter